MAQHKASTNVFVQDHYLGVLDGAHWDQDDDARANGLVSPLRRGAYIYTGIDTGYVRVTAAALNGPPGDPAREQWDEIVDVSIQARRASLRIRAFEDEADKLPALSQESGWHRLRVHARGRDTDIDGTADTPFEDYLIEVWKDDEHKPQVIHQASDRYGASLRNE